MITVTPIGDKKKPVGFAVVVDAEDMAAFQQMVHRATNLWPDAPISIKEFSDEVIHGEHMQNYQRLYGKKGTEK